MKQKRTYFLGWENIKWFFREILNTFSSKPSFLSSKRIERALMIMTGLILTCVFIWYKRSSLTPAEFLMLVSPLFVYAGYGMAKSKNDHKEITVINEEENKKNESVKNNPDVG